MTEIDEMIQNVSHRPWVIPNEQWRYYQEWNNAVFLHWKVSGEELKKNIPDNISIDSFKGEYWVSLVAFTMEKVRPRLLPSVSIVSDFHEINLRTYLEKDNKKGVYFLNIEAEKQISTFIAKKLSGLPYEKSSIQRQSKDEYQKYISHNKSKGFKFEISFTVGQKITSKSALDNWLTERYCLYLNKDNKLYRYEIHHKPWELREVKISSLAIDYKIGNILLNKNPDLIHYSTGVKVIAWQRKNSDLKITKN